MSKRLQSIILFLLIIIGASLLVFSVELNQKVPKPRGLQPTVVGIGAAQLDQWQPQIQATGTLQAENGVMLKSAVNQGGIITKILFKSGESVEAGQALFYINPDASVIVRAPFSGRLGLKLVDEGEYVAPGENLVPIANTDAMRVDFTIPQSKVANVRGGELVTIQVNAYPDEVFKGKVSAINTDLDLATRSLKIWATIPNAADKLIPGMFAGVTLFTDNKKSVVTVPQTAVVYNQAGNYVYRVIDGKAIVAPVVLGMRYKNRIVIREGLQAGDSIVISGTQKIYDGWPVKATDDDVAKTVPATES